MSIQKICQTCAPDPCVCSFSVVTGEERTIVIELRHPRTQAPIDLTDYTAIATLFFYTELAETIDAVTDTIIVKLANDKVTFPIVGDTILLEDSELSSDETMEVTAVSVDPTIITVDRLSSPLPHYADRRLRITRAQDIPVELAMGTIEKNPNDTSLVDRPLNDTDSQLWKSTMEIALSGTATSTAGTYYLQIALTDPDGNTVTLPRAARGYSIKIS